MYPHEKGYLVLIKKNPSLSGICGCLDETHPWINGMRLEMDAT